MHISISKLQVLITFSCLYDVIKKAEHSAAPGACVLDFFSFFRYQFFDDEYDDDDELFLWYG